MLFCGTINTACPPFIMNKTEICAKAVAVMLSVCAVVCASGREMLINAFAENKREDLANLDKSKKYDENKENKAITEIEELVNISALSRAKEKDLFLVKSIKYSVSEFENYICLSNSNQRWIYSKRADICIYFSYDCNIGMEKYSLFECCDIAKKAVLSVLSEKEYKKDVKIAYRFETEKVCTVHFSVPFLKDGSVKVCVRKDTGSVILFDAKCLDITEAETNNGY